MQSSGLGPFTYLDFTVIILTLMQLKLVVHLPSTEWKQAEISSQKILLPLFREIPYCFSGGGKI